MASGAAIFRLSRILCRPHRMRWRNGPGIANQQRSPKPLSLPSHISQSELGLNLMSCVHCSSSQTPKSVSEDQHSKTITADDNSALHKPRSKRLQKLRNSLRQLHNLNSLEQVEDTVQKTQDSCHSPQTQFGEESNVQDVPFTGGYSDMRDSVDVVDTEAVLKKYNFSNEKQSMKYENVLETSYGFIRFDGMAKRSKEQNSEDSILKNNKGEGDRMNITEMSSADDLFDVQYLSSHTSDKTDLSPERELHILDGDYISEITSLPKTDSKKCRQDEAVSPATEYNPEPGSNIFDQEYFSFDKGQSSQADKNVKVVHKSEIASKQEEASKSQYDTGNFFDEQFFSHTSEKEFHSLPLELPLEQGSYSKQNNAYLKDIQQSPDGSGKAVHTTQIDVDLNRKQDKTKNSFKGSRRSENRKSDMLEKEAIYADGPMPRRQQKSSSHANIDEPETAYDMLIKIRVEKQRQKDHQHISDDNATLPSGITPCCAKWTGKVDSMGFRILTDQTVDLKHLPEDTVVKILRDSIIYEDEKVIAIDKPYGLPSHGGPGVHHSVGKLLKPLAAKVRSDKGLYLVHRLDKETTGVMLLAKTSLAEKELLSMFIKRQIVKKYWAITKGVPNPTEGVIAIPMAEGEVGDKRRMVLRPNYSPNMKLMLKTAKEGRSIQAITNYKVLDSAGSVALVECQPETGVKHQIRCHLAFGLNTAILGDHKYSHLSKMAPQKLYPDILQRLGIRQAKVRHLAMHLHAKALVLPEFRDGRNVFISARLPKHFVQNMKWLKLKPPVKS